tara:strand:- start:44 stop:574 length:531 start_codon:yes stop_codon:yes gene_type:complete
MSILKVDTINEKTSGNGVAIPGHVVAVHNAISTVNAQAINSTSLVNITGLSITITPKNANNLIIMDAQVPTTNTYVTSYAFLKDGATTVTSLIDNQTGIPNVQLIQYMPEVQTTEVSQLMQVSLQHFETAGDTNSRTYTVACCSKWGSNSYNMYVNNRNSGDMPSFSTFRLMEVAQ